MKITFLVPYPKHEAPSQRFRFEQYFNVLAQKEFIVKMYPLLEQNAFHNFYTQKSLVQRLLKVIKGLIHRIYALLNLRAQDFVFIHREAAPIGPPLLEWIIAKILRKKIIYDFDDAIWLTDKTNESKIEKLLRWRGKVASICTWSYKVSCGNEYLANYARQFNSNVVVNPTTIDTENLHNPRKIIKKNSEKITIGWTGSHSTLKYLKEIELILEYLETKYPNVQILIIADKKPDLKLRNLEFLKWNKETEAEDLSKIDIGIMPLPDDEWSKGKCGFKALQYMAMEIPCVISPVGVNKQIIDHGVNGFLAESEQDWITHLEYLINNQSARIQLGLAGRQKVIEGYSVLSNTGNFLSLFE